jgi:hypothetical protein
MNDSMDQIRQFLQGFRSGAGASLAQQSRSTRRLPPPPPNSPTLPAPEILPLPLPHPRPTPASRSPHAPSRSPPCPLPQPSGPCPSPCHARARRDQAPSIRVYFPDDQELAVARTGLAADPSAGRAELGAKFDERSAFQMGYLTRQNAAWALLGSNFLGAGFRPSSLAEEGDRMFVVAYPSFNPRWAGRGGGGGGGWGGVDKERGGQGGAQRSGVWCAPGRAGGRVGAGGGRRLWRS